MDTPDEIGVYLGLTSSGTTVLDKRLTNSEPKLRAVVDKLAAKHGTVLVVVDQSASIGALPLAVARDAGCRVAYLPGLTMRRMADLYPGEAKTDCEHDVFGVLTRLALVPRGAAYTTGHPRWQPHHRVPVRPDLRGVHRT